MFANLIKIIFVFGLSILCLTALGIPKKVSIIEALYIIRWHPQREANVHTYLQNRKRNQGAYWELTPSFSVNRTWRDLESSDSEIQSFNYQAQLNLFKGFADYSNIKAKNRLHRQSKHFLESQVNEQEREVAEIFVECHYRQRVEKEASTALNIRNQLADIANQRFRRGTQSKDDYIKLKIDADAAKARLIRAKQEKLECHESLIFWIGFFDELKEPTLETDLKTFMDKYKPIEIPRSHPKALSFQSRWDQAKWDKYTTMGQFLPQLDLSYIDTPGTSFQTADKEWRLTATWTLFDSGQNWIDSQVANLNELTARFEYQEVLRDVEKILAQRRQLLDSHIEQYKILKTNHEQAQKIFKSSLLRFRKGAISANDVALDQSRVIESAFAMHDMWLLKNQSMLRFVTAHGKSISDTLNPQSPSPTEKTQKEN